MKKTKKSKQTEQIETESDSFLLKNEKDELLFWTTKEIEDLTLVEAINIGLINKLFLRWSILDESKNGEQFVENESLVSLLSKGLAQLYLIHPELEKLVFSREKSLQLSVVSN